MCGVLTTPGDPGAVAAALRSLIQDPSRRRALGAAGPNRAESLCDPGRNLRRLNALLKSSTSCRPSVSTENATADADAARE